MDDTLTKTQAKFELIPVLFANGEDDDTRGLVAVFMDERVQYGDKVYAPGEAIEVIGRVIHCHTIGGFHFLHDGETLVVPDNVIALRPPDNMRKVLFVGCQFLFCAAPLYGINGVTGSRL